MIKTMLLTAQLALSPIVGTNGLQPKLANTDPYTETDLVVSYNGGDYNRVLYGKTAYINCYTANMDIGRDFTYTANEVINNQGFTKVENLEALFFTTDVMEGRRKIVSNLSNECFSMFMGNNSPSDLQTYVEVIGQQIIVYNLQTHNIDYRTHEAVIYWSNAYWVFNAQVNNDWLNENRVIPYEQPTKRSNTLYNTIYDFYEGTIFNGAGIAEYETSIGENTMTMQQWLSHTATIATISLLCVAVAILVIKIFKLIAGSISDIWG